VPQSTPTPPSRLGDPRDAAPPLRLRAYSAAGNRFAVIDAFDRAFPRPDALARALCRAGVGGAGFDGVLFVRRPTADGDCRMLLHNADGSRAEACGNGLRCVALHARSTGLVGAARVLVETDLGTRAVEWLEPQPRGMRARAAMGAGRVVEREAELAFAGGVLRATLVDLGNPHCVVAVEDVGEADVARLGALLATHPRFPTGTNVEFAAREGEHLRLRVWERGVGETAACGTGACAAALALLGEGEFTVQVHSPGGTLTVEREADGALWLAGPCEAREWIEWVGGTE